MSLIKEQDKELLKVKNMISKQNEDVLFKIYLVVKNNKEQYTINKNGVYFDLTGLRNKTIMQIKKIINFD